MQKKALKLFHKPVEQLDFLKGKMHKVEMIEVMLRDLTPLKSNSRVFAQHFPDFYRWQL